MIDKEKIIIDGVDVSQCEFYIYYSSDRYPHRCGIHKDMFGMPACCDVADCCKNCYFKQLQKEKFENLNNRQMVESAENLIYENSELYKNIKEKEQECEELKKEQLEIKKYLGISHKSILERLEELQERRDELSEKNLSYEQALEEIEKKCCAVLNGDEKILYAYQIKDVINKAKDGE